MISHTLALELIKQTQELLRKINGVNDLDLRREDQQEAFDAAIAEIEAIKEAAKYIPGTIESLKGALIRDETMIAEGEKEAKRLLDETKAKLATAEGTLCSLEKADFAADRGDGHWEVNAQFAGLGTQALANGLVEMFRKAEAMNNLEIKFRDGHPDPEQNLGTFVLHMQRLAGKTAADQRKEAEDRIESARWELNALILSYGQPDTVPTKNQEIVARLAKLKHILDPANTDG